jgi:hypothetical protein
VSDERTLEEQCYGVCYAAKERIAELEAGNAAELRRLHAVNAELLEVLKELVDIVDGAVSDRSTGDMDSFTLQPARIAIIKATEVQP